MKGSYWFKAKSKKVLFEFSIRRNITVIKGDSATGKTTLLRILYEYLRIGRQSGYAVSTNASYYVYIRDEVGRDWKDALYPLKNTVIFIEENNEFVFTKEFSVKALYDLSLEVAQRAFLREVQLYAHRPEGLGVFFVCLVEFTVAVLVVAEYGAAYMGKVGAYLVSTARYQLHLQYAPVSPAAYDAVLCHHVPAALNRPVVYPHV